jgi:uncharacterized membrane protein
MVNVLGGVGVLVAFVILIALGGLLANEFTNAAALPDGNAFNVSSTTTTYYPTVITIAFVSILAMIGLPILFYMMQAFGGNRQ